MARSHNHRRQRTPRGRAVCILHQWRAARRRSSSSFGNDMTRWTKIALVAAATFLVGVAAYFWAAGPLGFASYLSSTGASDADIIRQYWPYRLVQPEWVSGVPDKLMNWHLAEAIVRLAVVSGSWLLFVGILGRGVTFTPMRRRRGKPNPLTSVKSRRPSRFRQMREIRRSWASMGLGALAAVARPRAAQAEQQPLHRGSFIRNISKKPRPNSRRCGPRNDPSQNHSYA